ncbi:peptidoglycan-binding domain-containing protein [Aequorivita echinoideorum]|uniref:Peptidoglycan binding domain-containing protein n=1 Tax=Aequorivita echinoideorum TaxID=1549647 RepID=A0ABS5S9W9_9FLAO|nr:peptidoglycan-binding domain-containing protein [Aequorivita echinoideorum]MBT0608665.1 hypothetical protein [Aequorivita echinoideorum]
MGTIYLGSCDAGSYPADRKQFLASYHKDGILVNKVSFRDDDRTTWRSFRQENERKVAELQTFLFKAGFMPRGVVDGVFDYVTQAAARLFQEYVRTVDPHGDKIMVPDGVVGNMTMKHVNRWKASGLISDWGKASAANPSEEYRNWMNLLKKSKEYYKNNPGPVMKHVNSLSKTYATLKVSDWNFDSNEIHLIGIRRKQDVSVNTRQNDDLFILLINGMVFKFWGSTDPSSSMAGRKDEPFLVEGQHKYRFGWHKISDENKIYRALKPYDYNGVMVLRDWNNDNAMTPADLNKPNSIQVNKSINIHWSGIGTSNFSAGCQVIAAKSYINHKDEAVDCSKFASRSYSELTSTAKKTKGAYNVLADLIVCFSKAGTNHIYYTLGREESMNLDANFGVDYVNKALQKMNP